MIALAQILSYVKLYEFPAGGAITLGSMVPILLFALRWGTGRGLLVAAIYGGLQFLLGPKWSFHPISILCDYVTAFGSLGLAGLFRKHKSGIVFGTVLGIFGRFVNHVISGVVVFAEYAKEGQTPLVYSISYNGAYLLPELGISLLILILLLKAKPTLLNPEL